VSVSAGQGNSCAIRGDHSLWCWGYNLNGMFQQDAAWRTTPTPVIQ
jgi:alpha-tubulin suppressor-like RCC1 family protein